MFNSLYFDLFRKFVIGPFQANIKDIIDIKYNDIDIAISGNHKFDKTLAYNATFNVPAKYLGSDINRLIGNINTKEINNISIPVTANINGTYSNPNIKTDLNTARITGSLQQ